MTATYHVSLGVFEGPFDLLLHLIARRKVDIYDIPVAEITDDYLAVVAGMETLDLEVTTEFLIVAATLLELKAARLLPDTEDPDLEELALEARDLLYARLLDYRTFKEASRFLRARLEVHSGYLPREVALEEAFAKLRPDAVLGLSPDAFARLAARVFAAQAATDVDLTHIQPARLSVREACAVLLERLTQETEPLTYADLTRGITHRPDRVVYFLALLELYKVDLVDLEQRRTFGDLTVTWTPERGSLDTRIAVTADTGDSEL